jgi:hypothetical protein
MSTTRQVVLGVSILCLSLAPPSTARADPIVLTLTPPDTGGFGSGVNNDNAGERGVFFLALDDFRITRVGMEIDPTAPSAWLEVRLYSGRDLSVKTLLSSGSAMIEDAGLRFYDVPLGFNLLEGEQYNVAVAYEPGAFDVRFFNFDPIPIFGEAQGDAPFEVGHLVRVLDGNANRENGQTNFVLGHFRLHALARTEPIPEPATVVLLTSGLLGVAMRVRSRRSARRRHPSQVAAAQRESAGG